MEFTDAQQQAIDHLEGNLQLIACAGSGKTEVVARRVVNLLTPAEAGGAGCQPENIIAFTFTEKAAAELKERIHERCREALGDVIGLAEMYVGTIHGFCLGLLQSELPEFLKYEVLNEVQQRLFVDRNSRKSGLTLSTTTDGKPLKRFTDTLHYVTAHSILREDVVVDSSRLETCTVAAHLPDYETLLHEKGYLDYSGILKEAITGLTCNLGNFMRTLALPDAVEQWSLTSLREKLIKIGAKIVRHGRYVTFQMAEVVIPRDLFADILRRIDRLRPPPAPA